MLMVETANIYDTIPTPFEWQPRPTVVPQRFLPKPDAQKRDAVNDRRCSYTGVGGEHFAVTDATVPRFKGYIPESAGTCLTNLHVNLTSALVGAVCGVSLLSPTH